MKVAYADPPYPGCAHLYQEHPDYAGEVDHKALLASFAEYDGWLLHTSASALAGIFGIINDLRFDSVRDGRGPIVPHLEGFRVMPWVKPFAAFKRNVSVAYAWEPVFVKACRKPVVSGRVVMRDWIAEPITLRRGLTGAKPEAVCRWAFEVLGMEADDELHDLFPGTGAVTDAWETWRSELRFAL